MSVVNITPPLGKVIEPVGDGPLADSKDGGDAIADGVDGIATTVTHETAFDDLIGRALEHHIPVVCFNTDASRGQGKQLASLVQDTYAAGVRLGNFMADRMESGAKALITLHSDGIDCLESRKKGIMDGLAEKKALGILWSYNLPAVGPYFR